VSRPKMALGKRMARSALQVFLKVRRTTAVPQGYVAKKLPRLVFRRMSGAAFVVIFEAQLEVVREADVGF